VARDGRRRGSRLALRSPGRRSAACLQLSEARPFTQVCRAPWTGPTANRGRFVCAPRSLGPAAGDACGLGRTPMTSCFHNVSRFCVSVLVRNQSVDRPPPIPFFFLLLLRSTPSRKTIRRSGPERRPVPLLDRHIRLRGGTIHRATTRLAP
jgi:hypothetical protein